MNRRHAISLAVGGLAFVPGCRRRQAAPPVVSGDLEGQALTPVDVDASFEIRTVTGLRPYRRSGFVVRKEEIGGKTLIHNYGHGGGGVSLSWGSAHLAVQMAGSVAGRSCAVIGGGVMGLSTARLLQLRGAEVTLYTSALPPDTTSNVAGAQWWPVSVFDRRHLTETFAGQFVEAANFSFRYFQELAGPRWGIRWLPNYFLSDDEPANGWIGGPGGALHDLQIGFRDFGPGEHVFPARFARRFHTMFIEPAIYLAALLQEAQAAGIRIDIRHLANADEALQLPPPVIFNCSGLGARELFGDDELTPIKGQLSFLLPQPAVDYNLLTDTLYMFPRSNGILLGGSFERGNWDLTPDPSLKHRIIEGHRTLFGEMRRLQQAARGQTATG